MGEGKTNPNHYSRWTIEPIDFIRANKIDALRANIIKYIMRFDAKDGLEDLDKAQQYLTWLREDFIRDRSGKDEAAVLAWGTGIQPDLFAKPIISSRRRLEGGSAGTTGGQRASCQGPVTLSVEPYDRYDSSPSSSEYPYDLGGH